MAYVQPNSRIEFFTDLGISQDYNDTLYFTDVNAKDTYFSNIDRLAHVDRCYYARDNRGFVRVELPMVTMIHAQYMRFKNTSYENKWWYAFVDDVIYVNDNTTEVKFTLDPMLTWMGEFHPKACFVERQHSVTDEVGENIVEENLELGNYLYSYRQNSGIFTPEEGYNDAWVYIMWFAPNSLISASGMPGIYDNVYSGCSYFVATTADALTAKINELVGANLADNIIAIRMIPAKMIPNYNPDNVVRPRTARTKTIRRMTSSWYGNYTPRNKKLYTYPYNFLTVTNSEGDSVELKYEFFGTQPPISSDSDITFNLYSFGGTTPKLMCVPSNYMGQVDCYPNALTMQSFPMCSWNVDGYKAYIAQLETSLPTQMLSSAFNGATSALVNQNPSSVSSGLTGAIQPINNLLATYIGHPTMPSAIKGQGTSDAYIASRTKDFYFYRTTIDEVHCKIIDNYFTMFGYADRTVHEPQMNVRQRFTYVKTIACKIDCMCPAEDINKIESIFNNGIRFWKDHTQIGNYSDDNLPYTQGG